MKQLLKLPTRAKNKLKGSKAVVTPDASEREDSVGSADPVADATHHDASPAESVQERHVCWYKALSQLKEEDSEIYKQLVQSQDSVNDKLLKQMQDRIDGYEKKASRASSSQWFGRLKRFLPALASVKAVSMAVARADPHQLAPYICAGVFCAIELTLNVVTDEDELLILILELASEMSVMLQKWWLKEERLTPFLANANTKSLANEISNELPILYGRILRLYHDITSYLESSRKSKAWNKFSHIDVKWKASFETVKRSNKKCDAAWSNLEFLAKVRKDDEAVLDWISSKLAEVSHSQIMDRTGVVDKYRDRSMWFFQSSEFQEWRQGLNTKAGKQVLWLRGSVGTGKTTTICRTVETLMLDESLDDTVFNRICAFYCQASGQVAPAYEDVIRDLLRQLALLSDYTLAESMEEAYQRYKQDPGQKSKLSLTQLEDLFRSVVASHDSHKACVFVIDALDECAAEIVQNLLEFFQKLVTDHANIYLIVSSQLHINTDSFFESQSFATVEMGTGVVADDIEFFIDTEIQARSDLPGNKNISVFSQDWNEDIRNEFRNELLSEAQGMFQWVKIWLGMMFPVEPIILRAEAEELLGTLKVPSSVELNDLDLLNQAYFKLYTRVRHRPVDQIYKRRIYRIILGAKEPLSAAIVAVAASVEDNGTMVTGIDKNYVCKVCHNFFVETDNQMMPAHDSARHFLQTTLPLMTTGSSTHGDCFSPALCNAELAQICIRVIMQADHPFWSDSGFNPKWWATKFSTQKHIDDFLSTLRYIEESATEGCTDLESIPSIPGSSIDASQSWDLLSTMAHLDGFALYVINWTLTHWESVIVAIENGIIVQDQLPLLDLVAALCSIDQSALPGCIFFKYMARNVRWEAPFVPPALWMEDSTISLSPGDLCSDFRILYQAVRSKFDDYDRRKGDWQLSLREVDANNLIIEVTFLVMACKILPQQYFTEYLLNHKYSNAIERSKLAGVKTLLEKCQARLTLQNYHNNSVLAVAVERGETMLVENILRMESKQCLKTSKKQLVWTSELMLQRNHDGEVPLHRAASGPNTENMVALLLNSEADQTGCHFAVLDANQWKPSGWLSRNACLTDDHGQTALHKAARAGEPAVVSLLLQAGAAEMRLNNDPLSNFVINARDRKGLSPIAHALKSYPGLPRSLVVRALLAIPTIDPNIQDDYGNTPLHLLFVWRTLTTDDERALEILLDHPETKAGLRNIYWETPIHRAARSGSISSVRLLCGKPDVNPGVPDIAGRTPLWYAEYGRLVYVHRNKSPDRWIEIIDLLTATGQVNLAPRDGKGQTPQEAYEANRRAEDERRRKNLEETN